MPISPLLPRSPDSSAAPAGPHRVSVSASARVSLETLKDNGIALKALFGVVQTTQGPVLRKNSHVVLERFEGKLAVLELQHSRNPGVLDRRLLPKSARANQWLNVSLEADGKAVRFEVNLDATRKAEEKAQALLDQLNSRDTPGTIDFP